MRQSFLPVIFILGTLRWGSWSPASSPHFRFLLTHLTGASALISLEHVIIIHWKSGWWYHLFPLWLKPAERRRLAICSRGCLVVGNPAGWCQVQLLFLAVLPQAGAFSCTAVFHLINDSVFLSAFHSQRLLESYTTSFYFQGENGDPQTGAFMGRLYLKWCSWAGLSAVYQRSGKALEAMLPCWTLEPQKQSGGGADIVFNRVPKQSTAFQRREANVLWSQRQPRLSQWATR